jgi:predicted secreted hydrolase
VATALVWAGALGAGCDEDPDREAPPDPQGVCPEAWRTYPHQPPGTEIRFPDDEGQHYDADPEVTMEWWYTIYHLTTPEGREFSIMATFFMPQLDMAYRPFNITDVDNDRMYPSDEWGTLEAGEGPLDLVWTSDNPEEPVSTFAARRYANGDPVPFAYEQHLVYVDPADPSRSQSLHLTIDSLKSPYIVDGDGYVTIGEAGESWYYSLTHLEVSGELELDGEVFEVTGRGWLDHQWGPFMLHPLANTPITYEWMALHLDNGDEYMVSTLFDRDDQINLTEGFGSVGWKTADCAQGITLDHTVERLGFWYHEGSGDWFSHSWRIVVPDTGLDVVVTPVIEDQTVPFFHTYFYEGRSLVTGTLDGEPVTGLAFSELTHHYDAPEVAITAPTADATHAGAGELTVRWEVANPDDGMPLQFDVTLSDGASTQTLCQDLTAPPCTASATGMSGPCTLSVLARSVDRTVTGSDSIPLRILP